MGTGPMFTGTGPDRDRASPDRDGSGTTACGNWREQDWKTSPVQHSNSQTGQLTEVVASYYTLRCC